MAKTPYKNEADYVVVGSGSSGAAIAGRLAQSGASVIVLEAGKSDEQYLVKKPGMIGPMHSVPEIKKRVDWGYYSTPQKHLLDRKMPVPRGKVVGGSSSINGMVYVRGNRANYDSWAAEGCTGWSADEVNAAYRRMEDFEDGANDYRGAGGPIKVTRNAAPQEGSLQFIQATSDVLGVKVLDDYNAESQEGVSRMQQNAAGGLRYSASRGYLHDLDVPTLQLQTEVLVRKVVIENGRATGVEVTDKNGSRRTVRA
ncbi:MAG: GMC family oxidoreductase N-terminal domain-containing protein, partial [Nocardioides sp.]|nr:GMC family oxidoreductase N-terminal domain-containing protein [Nocardioides sp.]